MNTLLMAVRETCIFLLAIWTIVMCGIPYIFGVLYEALAIGFRGGRMAGMDLMKRISKVIDEW